MSQNFIMEPPDRQDVGIIPISVKKKDFSRYEQNHICGFAEIGSQDMNYKYCLVKIKLLPEFESKFSLLKDEMTVQVKRNVWLEFIPKIKGYENLLPKNGIIGHAMSIMNEYYVEEMFRSVSPVAFTDMKDAGSSKVKDEDAYESMMMKLDMDISVRTSTQEGDVNPQLNLLDKTLRGVTNELVAILPASERSLILFLQSDDEFDPKNLLKMQVEVTNNEEFKYYNNCYNIDRQICTVVNSNCKYSNSSKPSVKVVLKNQRSEVAHLPANSSVALVKIHRISSSETAKPAGKEPSRTELPAVVQEPKVKAFSAAKSLEKLERKCMRTWERVLNENTFAKSLSVEEKFPYFTVKPRPKIPFGLKLKDLLMRVGLNQDSRPTRVSLKQVAFYQPEICCFLISLKTQGILYHSTTSLKLDEILNECFFLRFLIKSAVFIRALFVIHLFWTSMRCR